MSHPGRCLREMMQKGAVAAPGAFNGLTARLVADAKFDACYVSGAAISASMGLPDIGVVSVDSFARVIKEVTTVSKLMCLADADTGFGEGEMVRRTVAEYNSAGAAGFHIEDQTFPKRCGHLEGKSLIPAADMAEKVKRAVKASDELSNGDFIVCARTDARSVTGVSDAIERATKYAEAGAHMIFPEGLQSKEEFQEFAAAMRSLPGGGLPRGAPQGGPFLLANITEFGVSPLLPVSELSSMGYHLVIFPVSTLRVAMKPVQELLRAIQTNGTVETEVDKMFTRKELYSTLRYTPGVEWEYPSPPTKGQ